jgi:hypothetical protein
MPDKDLRTIRFTFICNIQERQLITAIAEHLNRSQGDAIRFLIRTAAQELKTEPTEDQRKAKNSVENPQTPRMGAD